MSLHRTHEVLINVCIERGGQISGEEDRCQREVGRQEGGKWPTSSHHHAHTEGCGQFGPLRNGSSFNSCEYVDTLD